MMNISEGFAVLLDAGHGGISPKTREYTTSPNKMHKHSSGDFHKEGYYFEGVANRIIADKILLALQKLHIPVFQLHHEYEDTPLHQRVEIANEKHQQYPYAIGLSIHQNASPNHNAEGLEAFTSPGQTKSDILASLLYLSWKSYLGNSFKIREDFSDGDHDKEARFYMLTKTRLPFVLSENGFFDHPVEALNLMHPRVQEVFAFCHVQAILLYAVDNGLIW